MSKSEKENLFKNYESVIALIRNCHGDYYFYMNELAGNENNDEKYLYIRSLRLLQNNRKTP